MLKMNHVYESRLRDALHELSNRHRLTILIWLTEPEKHFPPQRDGDLVKDGVCVGFITEKIGLRSPTPRNGRYRHVVLDFR